MLPPHFGGLSPAASFAAFRSASAPSSPAAKPQCCVFPMGTLTIPHISKRYEPMLPSPASLTALPLAASEKPVEQFSAAQESLQILQIER